MAGAGLIIAAAAAFLGTATGNWMTTAALGKAFLMHDQMLLNQVEVFVGNGYGRAQDVPYFACQDMFGLARLLPNAFGVTVAPRLPVGGVRTGGGGMTAILARRAHGG